MTTPTAYSWLLIGTPGAPSGTAGAGTGTAAPALDCPIEPLTQDDLLEMMERIYPVSYLEPLKDPGPGYELLQGFAKMMARASEALAHTGCQAFILSSTGPAFATGAVELYREAPHPEGLTVTVKAGTIVKASRSGRRFLTTEDVIFNPADLGPKQVVVQAAQPGYDYNLPGIVMTAAGEALPGDIDTVVSLVEDPPVGDITIQVRQTATATGGGVDPGLDQHGLDREIVRISGETDAAFRARVRALPDNISPDAFQRVVRAALLRYGITDFQLIETWSVAYQTCWDAPSEVIAGSNFNPNLFVYDDPDPDLTPFRNRWLDTNDYRGGVIIVVPAVAAIADRGMVWDDPAANALDLRTPAGTRSASAWDIPSTFTVASAGAFDGFDLQGRLLYKGLYQALQDIKAAGISVAVELKGE